MPESLLCEPAYLARDSGRQWAPRLARTSTCLPERWWRADEPVSVTPASPLAMPIPLAVPVVAAAAVLLRISPPVPVVGAPVIVSLAAGLFTVAHTNCELAWSLNRDAPQQAQVTFWGRDILHDELDILDDKLGYVPRQNATRASATRVQVLFHRACVNRADLMRSSQILHGAACAHNV